MTFSQWQSNWRLFTCLLVCQRPGWNGANMKYCPGAHTWYNQCRYVFLFVGRSKQNFTPWMLFLKACACSNRTSFSTAASVVVDLRAWKNDRLVCRRGKSQPSAAWNFPDGKLEQLKFHHTVYIRVAVKMNGYCRWEHIKCQVCWCSLSFSLSGEGNCGDEVIFGALFYNAWIGNMWKLHVKLTI